MITITSFGHRYGKPDADYRLDLRSLKNPHHDRRLRKLTGLDIAVKHEVMKHKQSRDLLDQAAAKIAGITTRPLHIAIGCTAGRHRSVVFAEEIARQLRARGEDVTIVHREKATWR